MKDKIINIEGVQLNETVIDTIQWLQEYDNQSINDSVKDVTDTVFFLINNKLELEENQRPQLEILLPRLGKVRNYLLGLKAITEEPKLLD